MASNHKLKLLYLKTILLEKTDKDHGLTMQEILEELEKNDIQAERKAIYRDLKTLEDSGLAVKKKKSQENCLSTPMVYQEAVDDE